jgi:hypothetical protein
MESRSASVFVASALSLVLAIVCYVGLAIPIYAGFYTLDPYNEDTGAGLLVYEVLLITSFVTHLLLTILVVVGAGRLLRWPLRPVALTAALVVALFAFPTMSFLASGSDCQGLSFPWPSTCITQEGD